MDVKEANEIVDKAISDLDDIETAIEEKGVDVADGTPTSNYDDKIKAIPGGGDSVVKYIESSTDNMVYLRDLESGTYVLYGKFRPYNGSTSISTFSSGMLVSVIRNSTISYIQIFYSKNNTIQYCEITDDTYTRHDAKLINMETVANKTNTVDADSDDEHYPTAKAVYDAMELKRIESLDEENLVCMRDIESGYYLLHGYFKPFPNSDTTVILDTMCVSVARQDDGSHLMAFSPLNFKIHMYEILVDDTAEGGFVFNSWTVKLWDIEPLPEKVAKLETQVGDIDIALDSIITMQTSYIGGES